MATNWKNIWAIKAAVLCCEVEKIRIFYCVCPQAREKIIRRNNKNIKDSEAFAEDPEDVSLSVGKAHISMAAGLPMLCCITMCRVCDLIPCRFFWQPPEKTYLALHTITVL